MRIKSNNVLVGNKFTACTVVLSDGMITDIQEYSDEEAIDYKDAYIVPGFIDLHIHGNYGIDSMDNDTDNIKKISRKLIAEGVTSYLITTTTDSPNRIKEVLENISLQIENQSDELPKCIGIHLEGPFLEETYAGAQKKGCMLNASVEQFNEFYDASRNNIRRVTIAPEKDNRFQLIKHLRDKNILVSMGHTGIYSEDAKKAIDGGVNYVTHTFNGMREFSHHDVAAIGVSLLDDRVMCEVIADGNHVSYDAIKILVKLKGEKKVVLATDSNKAKGLLPGEYIVNNRPIIVNEKKEARLKSNGSLAGSIVSINDCIRNMVNNVGVSKEEAFKMASLYPAQALNIDKEKGSIEVGRVADIVIVDDNFEIIDTYIKGKKVKN